MKKKRKLLSILLILAMCLQLLPTTALAVDETAKTSHNYLDSFDITYPDNTPVSMLDENKKIVPFEFKPDKLTYDIVLPDATMPLFPTLAQTQFKASLSENFAGTAKLSSMWSKTGTDFANGSSHIFADNGLQHSINYATLQLMPIMADASKAVQSRYYIIGLSDSPVGDVSKFSKQDVYTFKFYFQPRLQSLTAISGENTYSEIGRAHV